MRFDSYRFWGLLPINSIPYSSSIVNCIGKELLLEMKGMFWLNSFSKHMEYVPRDFFFQFYFDLLPYNFVKKKVNVLPLIVNIHVTMLIKSE